MEPTIYGTALHTLSLELFRSIEILAGRPACTVFALYLDRDASEYFVENTLMASDRSSCQGFTLVELLVVLAIIGILSAVAFPMYGHHRKKAFDMTTLADLKGARSLVESLLIDEHLADHICEGNSACRAQAPELKLASSTSAVCWEVAAGVIRGICACARKGSVREYCLDPEHEGAAVPGASCSCSGEV